MNHAFKSPNFEDAALQYDERDIDLYGLTLLSLVGETSVWANKLYTVKVRKSAQRAKHLMISPYRRHQPRIFLYYYNY